MDINAMLQILITIMLTLSNVIRVMAGQFISTSFIEVRKCSYNYDYKWDIRGLEKKFNKLQQMFADCFIKLHLIASFKSFTSFEGRWVKKIEGFKKSLWSLIQWCAKYYRFHNFGYSTKSNKYTGAHPVYLDSIESREVGADYKGEIYKNVDPWFVHALELVPAELVNTKMYVPSWEYIVNGKKFYTFIPVRKAWDIECWEIRKKY